MEWHARTSAVRMLREGLIRIITADTKAGKTLLGTVKISLTSRVIKHSY